jgi:hypothetical protein
VPPGVRRVPRCEYSEYPDVRLQTGEPLAVSRYHCHTVSSLVYTPDSARESSRFTVASVSRGHRSIVRTSIGMRTLVPIVLHVNGCEGICAHLCRIHSPQPHCGLMRMFRTLRSCRDRRTKRSRFTPLMPHPARSRRRGAERVHEFYHPRP